MCSAQEVCRAMQVKGNVRNVAHAQSGIKEIVCTGHLSVQQLFHLGPSNVTESVQVRWLIIVDIPNYNVMLLPCPSLQKHFIPGLCTALSRP